MAVTARIKVEGIPEIQAALKAMPGKATIASARATRTVSAWAVSEIIKDMSARTGIPQKVFRDKRVKTRGLGGGDRLVWGGYNTIGTKYIAREGELENQLAANYWKEKGRSYDYGVKVGQYVFLDAVVLQMPNGYIGVFKRVGGRLEEQRVTIPMMPDVVERIQQESTGRLLTAFAKEMRWEMSKPA